VTDDLAHRLQAVAAEVVTALRQVSAPRDWLDELEAGGDAVKADEAAFIADVSVDTVRRMAIAASEGGKPIGILVAGSLWLISRRRLLDAIELKEGRPARLQAESRARKSAEMRSPPQNSSRNLLVTAAGTRRLP